jgi:putative transcriptional regulator
MASKTKKAKDRTDEIFAEMATGLSEAVSYIKGDADKKLFKAHIPETVDVAAIRKEQHLSQEEFAKTYGFSTATIRDYEQKRRSPDSAVRAYLLVIQTKAQVVQDVVCPIMAKVTGKGEYEIINGHHRYKLAHDHGMVPEVTKKLDGNIVEIEMRSPN